MNRISPRQFIVPALLFFFTLPVLSQRSRVQIYSTGGDSISCGANISAYRTFFGYEFYYDAQPTWLSVFDECPDSSERIYLDGATMYRFFIESTPEGPLRESRIDTLMLIYDRRMEHFGGEGNVLGRKGKDLLTYRGSDLSQVQLANEMLRKSIELEGRESQEAVMLLGITSGVVLTKRGLLDVNRLIGDYAMVSGILAQLEKQNPRWQRTRAKVEEILFGEDLFSCRDLDSYFGPLMELNRDSTAFQETVISVYEPLACERSPVIAAASENLYRLEPGPAAAHALAMQNIARNDLEKAEYYLSEALKGENMEESTRAQWLYELGVVSNALGDYCRSIESAREAIGLKDNFGQAYLLLGDAVIAARKDLGDDFQKRTAYWVAADMYEAAADADPSLAEEAGKKRSRALAQFPDKEEIFFSDIREGEAYRVEGCINDTTTVRSRQ